jgi:hypothetical protein
VAGWLDGGGAHPRAARWRQGAQAAGFGCVTALANAAFGPATLRHRQEGGHGLFAGAREVVDTLRADGVELVIVSNSEPAKLVAPFDAAGIERIAMYAADAATRRSTGIRSTSRTRTAFGAGAASSTRCRPPWTSLEWSRH